MNKGYSLPQNEIECDISMKFIHRLYIRVASKQISSPLSLKTKELLCVYATHVVQTKQKTI